MTATLMMEPEMITESQEPKFVQIASSEPQIWAGQEYRPRENQETMDHLAERFGESGRKALDLMSSRIEEIGQRHLTSWFYERYMQVYQEHGKGRHDVAHQLSWDLCRFATLGRIADQKATTAFRESLIALIEGRDARQYARSVRNHRLLVSLIQKTIQRRKYYQDTGCLSERIKANIERHRVDAKVKEVRNWYSRVRQASREYQAAKSPAPGGRAVASPEACILIAISLLLMERENGRQDAEIALSDIGRIFNGYRRTTLQGRRLAEIRRSLFLGTYTTNYVTSETSLALAA
jgi:hypothetical protein